MKWVFARVDKIGDLVLTLPVDQFPEAKFFQISWITSDIVSHLMTRVEPSRKFISVETRFSIHAFLKIYKFLKHTKPIGFVCFQAPWWVAAAAYIARVPNRFGRLSQWYSYLFFNKGLRQTRSLSEKSEFEYNLDLVRLAFQNQIDGSQLFLKLKTPESNELFSKFSIEPQRYIVLHPGMAGSADNWPSENYISLGQKLLSQNIRLVITGTKSDEVYLAPLRHPLKEAIWTDGKLSFDELLQVLKNAKAVVAPSTGVLHLSASLGTKSLGLYSASLAHSAVRWGARGQQVQLFSPTNKSMDSISVESIYNALLH